MNKWLVVDLSRRTGLTYKNTEIFIKDFFDSILDITKKDWSLTIVWYWSFSLRNRKSRRIKNPITWKEMFTKEIKALLFSPAKRVKDIINNP